MSFSFGISNKERTPPPNAMGKQEIKPGESCATTIKNDYALRTVSHKRQKGWNQKVQKEKKRIISLGVMCKDMSFFCQIADRRLIFISFLRSSSVCSLPWSCWFDGHHLLSLVSLESRGMRENLFSVRVCGTLPFSYFILEHELGQFRLILKQVNKDVFYINEKLHFALSL